MYTLIVHVPLLGHPVVLNALPITS